MSALHETFVDATTTITCLTAAVAGAASDAAGSFAVSALNLNGSGLGGTGLSFCTRAVVSAGCFTAVSRLMPETSQNVFFAILYFAADGRLVGDGVRIGTLLVNLVLRTLEPARVRPPQASSSCCADTTKKCDECSNH